MYYPCSENKGADQLRGYREADLRLCFRICKKPVFSQRGSFSANIFEKTFLSKIDDVISSSINLLSFNTKIIPLWILVAEVLEKDSGHPKNKVKIQHVRSHV